MENNKTISVENKTIEQNGEGMIIPEKKLLSFLGLKEYKADNNKWIIKYHDKTVGIINSNGTDTIIRLIIDGYVLNHYRRGLTSDNKYVFEKDTKKMTLILGDNNILTIDDEGTKYISFGDNNLGFRHDYSENGEEKSVAVFYSGPKINDKKYYYLENTKKDNVFCNVTNIFSARLLPYERNIFVIKKTTDGKKECDKYTNCGINEIVTNHKLGRIEFSKFLHDFYSNNSGLAKRILSRMIYKVRDKSFDIGPFDSILPRKKKDKEEDITQNDKLPRVRTKRKTHEIEVCDRKGKISNIFVDYADIASLNVKQDNKEILSLNISENNIAYSFEINNDKHYKTEVNYTSGNNPKYNYKLTMFDEESNEITIGVKAEPIDEGKIVFTTISSSGREVSEIIDGTVEEFFLGMENSLKTFKQFKKEFKEISDNDEINKILNMVIGNYSLTKNNLDIFIKRREK